MKINFYKLLNLFFIFLILFSNISLAQNNTDNLDIKNPTDRIYLQHAYICYPYNLTNNTSLGDCLTSTIYGLDNLDENLDNNGYIYDEELNIYWLNQGISLHLIFHNESYDLGIANISYNEYIEIRNKIINYFHTNGTIFNETYYYLNNKLIARNDSKNLFFYHPDNLGSTALVTNQSGSIVEEEFYLPYGDIYSGEEDSRFLYTGKEKDKDTGLYYYGARYYYPSQKQFIQPDPIIAELYNPQNLNRYAYVLNNPYKYVDDSGNIPVDVVVDVGFVVWGIVDFVKNPSLENFGYLGADIGFALVPFVPNVKRIGEAGKLVKGLDNVGDVSDAANAIFIT